MSNSNDLAKANLAYNTEVHRLMADVERVLHAEWPDTHFNCYDIAVFIHSLQTHKKYRGQPKKRAITPLESSAKKFLTDLKAHRRWLLESRHEGLPDAPAGFVEELLKVDLEQMDTAERAVMVFLEKPQPLNRAEEMGRRLRDACARAGVEMKRGTKEDQPYCRIVTELLAKGGFHKEPATIAEMLRGRAQRVRSGKPRGDREGAQTSVNRAHARAQKQPKTALRPAG